MWKMVRSALLFGILPFIWVTQGHANPACHSVLTGDTELTGDLDCSAVPGDPLAVGANEITLRLNGWTLTCPPGFVNSGGELDVEGIRATGRTGVIVLGPGTITGCGRAVTFEGGSNNLAAGLTAVGNLTGIVFIGETNSTAWNNKIVGNLGNGIELSSVTGVQILSNLIEHNGGDSSLSRGYGLTSDNVSAATICGNRIMENVRGGVAEVGASHLSARLCDNVILGNGGPDLTLRDSDDRVLNTVCETSTPGGLCKLPPAPTLLLNQVLFHPGERLTLSATVTPGSAPATVDAYVALRQPNGSQLFLQGDGSLTSAVQPFAQNWSVGSISGSLFSYTFGTGEPPGIYTWSAAFTIPGTLSLLGSVGSASFAVIHP